MYEDTRSECDEYIRIFKYICHKYLFGLSFVSFFFSMQKLVFLCILFGHSFVNVLECERYLNIHSIFRIQIFIRTFVCVKCCLQIYADIRSCRKFYECYTLDQMVTETTYYPLLNWRILRFDDDRPLGPLGGQNGQYKVQATLWAPRNLWDGSFVLNGIQNLSISCALPLQRLLQHSKVFPCMGCN